MGNRSAYINNIDSAKKEFKQIIETYIKPLIDIKGNLCLSSRKCIKGARKSA